VIRLLGEMWQISGGPLTHPWDASAYLINGDEPALIDCGSAEGYPALKRALIGFGYQPRDIKRVIGTHGHWDHLSGMARLREESDAKLYLHEMDAAQVESGDSVRTAAELYLKPFPPTPVDGFLHEGDVLTVNDFTFTVYHTPGHSPGSICLRATVVGTGLLVAGDTLWGGYSPRVGSDLEAWATTLDRLLEVDFDVVTIGHGRPGLIFNPKRLIREARVRFGKLLDPWFTLAAVG